MRPAHAYRAMKWWWDMKRRSLSVVGLVAMTALILVALFGTPSLGPVASVAAPQPAHAQLACPPGYIFTQFGCVPNGAGGCPFGYVLTAAGCVPNGAGGCPVGYVLTG